MAFLWVNKIILLYEEWFGKRGGFFGTWLVARGAGERGTGNTEHTDVSRRIRLIFKCYIFGELLYHNQITSISVSFGNAR